MKNVITCKNCNTENPYFSYICNNCRSYLRERVVNIDLWKTIGTIIESPSAAFTNIIHAEHKNFVSFLYFLFGMKFFINVLLIADPVFHSIRVLDNVSFVFLFSITSPLIVILVFSLIFTRITRVLKVKTRFKDNFSILLYSLIPGVFSLIFFFPVELVLFGSALFVANPSPFILKPTPAIVMVVLEFLMLLWSVVLGYFAVYSATRSRIFSLVTTLVFQTVLIGLLLLITRLFS